MTDQPDLIAQVRFNDQGLAPAIVQQWDSGEVLMMAWMNQEALKLTIETRQATYFSRSRSKLWVKGESSGNFQEVRGIKLDCDGDTILLAVNQRGVACHTGLRSCFDAVGDIKA